MRQTRVEISIGGGDATESLTPYLLSFSHSDSIDKKSDSISISLFDKDWRHLTQWVITKGTQIKATIIQEDEGGAESLECGKMEVDDISFSIGTDGSTLEIKANSVPVKGTAKGSKKYRAWEGADLKTITDQVAKDSQLDVDWQVSDNAKLSRTDQDGESDLELLQRLATENGHSLKISDGKVIVFDEEEWEKRPPWIEIKPGASLYDSMKLHTTATGKFKSADASWTSPRTGKTIREKFSATEPPEGAGGDLWQHRRYNRDGDDDEDEAESPSVALANEEEYKWAVGNQAEKKGERKAKGKKRASKELREANKDEWTVSFSAPGNVKWNAGQTFTLSGEFGKFGRKYICTDVTHKVSRSDGYTCDIKGRGILTGY